MADHKSGLYIYFLAIYMNDDVEVWNKIKRLYNSPHSCLLPVNWVDTLTEVRKPRSRLWRITKKTQQEISLTCLRLFCSWRIEELIKIHWFIFFDMDAWQRVMRAWGAWWSRVVMSVHLEPRDGAVERKPDGSLWFIICRPKRAFFSFRTNNPFFRPYIM